MSIKHGIAVFLFLFIMPATTAVFAAGGRNGSITDFSDYLRSFDYQEHKDMKISVEELKKLHQEGKVQIVDIRFPEETALWSISFATRIPLNELPDRLAELDRNKIIVTVCPHYDRSSLARHYLALHGYRARYLESGMLKLAEELRGDAAREFYNQTRTNQKK
jgi:rhodanese-related sulfurtransferase